MKDRALLILTFLMMGSACAADVSPSIIGMRAYSLITDEGTPHYSDFDSENLLEPGAFLFNRFLTSRKTLVLIEVHNPQETTLEIKANDQHAVEYSRALKISPTKNNRVSVPVLLPNTGCFPVSIEATLKDKTGKSRSKKQETIPFQCGE